MTARRLILGAAALVLCLVAVLLGGVFDDSSPAGSAVVPPASAGRRIDTGFAQGDTAAVIARPAGDAPRRIRTTCARSTSSRSRTSSARGRRAIRRTTRSPASALHRALGVAPRDLVATSGLGSLALSRHRFAEALALGRRARAISPTTARNYGVIGDALVELGRYREAFRAFDTMASLQPGLSSYARIAHARDLRRRPAGRDRVDEARARRLGGTGRSRRPGHIFSSESSTGRADSSAAARVSSATR